MCREFNRKVHNLLPFPGFHYSVNILTCGVWPSLPESEFEDLDKTNAVQCPAEMQAIISTVNAMPVDSERNYRWSFVRGYVTMAVEVGGREVLMQMLPIQGVVLMQFQHDEIWSLQELADRVNVNMNLIKQVVSSLLFSRYQVRVVVSHSHTVAEAGGRRERSQPHRSRHLQFGVQSEGRPNSLKGGRCERRG